VSEAGFTVGSSGTSVAVHGGAAPASPSNDGHRTGSRLRGDAGELGRGSTRGEVMRYVPGG